MHALLYCPATRGMYEDMAAALSLVLVISFLCNLLSSYLLGLLAKIKCSISSSQPDL